MIDHKKVAKLIQAIQELSQRLRREQNLSIHKQINHFYLMEKAEELDVLREQLATLQTKTELLSAHLTKEYDTVFTYWSKSAKLFNRYLSARDCLRNDS